MNFFPIFLRLNQTEAGTHHKMSQQFEDSESRESSKQPQSSTDVGEKINSSELPLLDRWIKLVFCKLHRNYRSPMGNFNFLN